MRLTGWVLLLIGGLMCATIAWAAIGFLLMGIGLISLQVAERRRRGIDDAVPAGAVGFTPPRLSPGLQPPTFDPGTGQDAGPPRQPRRVAWPDKAGPDKASSDKASPNKGRPDKSNGAPYDREAWRRLVERDPDLADLADVLADYGPQYVDELAASYLAAPDKNRLEAIVNGIVARARDGQPVPSPVPAERSGPPPLPPRPEPKPVIAATSRPAAPPPLPPAPSANPADALETSLLATVEEASARLAAERAGLFKPGREPSKATENRPPTANQREPLFGRAPRDTKPAAPPPMPIPAETPADLEASLIAAVSQAAAKRADTPKPPPIPERAPIAAKPEQDARAVAPNQPKPAPPAPLPPPPAIIPLAKRPAGKTAADDLDETLLAALAEISGQKFKDEPKPDSPGPPADDGLSEMIKKFAPDSQFLRKQ